MFSGKWSDCLIFYLFGVAGVYHSVFMLQSIGLPIIYMCAQFYAFAQSCVYIFGEAMACSLFVFQSYLATELF